MDMNRFSRSWHRVPKAVRQPLVFIAGGAVIITGLVGLALPILPGWALIFVGFAVLATEFTFAERARDWTIHVLKRAANAGKRAWRKARRRQG